jgi:hypothetical protein
MVALANVQAEEHAVLHAHRSTSTTPVGSVEGLALK